MARPLRIQFEGAWYHVMNRGIAHKQIFFSTKHKQMFLTFLAEIYKIYGIETHAYCLMDNHYHLIIHTPRGNLSDAIQYLNSKFAQYVNFTMKRDGPLFRGRYKAIIISADDYLIRLSKYIHLNPVSAKILKLPEKYKWSSYPVYLGKEECPTWLITREIMTRFGLNDFHKLYKIFVETKKDEELEKIYAKSKLTPVLGDTEYRNFIFDTIKSHSLSAEIVGANDILVPPKIINILEKVAHYFDIDIQKIKYRSQKINNPPRRIAIYLCREIGGYSLKEIAKEMGNVSIKTISNTIARTKQETHLMKDISYLIKEITKHMEPLNQK